MGDAAVIRELSREPDLQVTWQGTEAECQGELQRT